MTTSRCLRALLFCFGVCLLTATDSKAQIFNLTSGNSTVTINAERSYGMSDWTVDCVPQLYRQWFWYGLGTTGGEKPVNQLNMISAQQTGDNMLTTRYKKGDQFSVEISYSLLGGAAGTGYSTIGEQIKIINLSNVALDFHFFQYVDFDLGGSSAGDTVQLGKNISGQFDSAYQNKGNSFFADEVISPAANHGQAGLYPSIYSSLIDGMPTTLTDSTGPVTGDATWAFQWDASIPVGGSFSVALNKSVFVTNIPEPTVLALVPVALALLGGARRRWTR